MSYRGRTMRDSHVHLDITALTGRCFVDDTVRILDEVSVARREQRELIQLMDARKPEIVKRSTQGRLGVPRRVTQVRAITQVGNASRKLRASELAVSANAFENSCEAAPARA